MEFILAAGKGLIPDIIIAVVLLILVGAAVHYIRKEKKKGTVCIGCPDAGHCSRKTCCGGTVNNKKK